MRTRYDNDLVTRAGNRWRKRASLGKRKGLLAPIAGKQPPNTRGWIPGGRYGEETYTPSIDAVVALDVVWLVTAKPTNTVEAIEIVSVPTIVHVLLSVDS